MLKRVIYLFESFRPSIMFYFILKEGIVYQSFDLQAGIVTSSVIHSNRCDCSISCIRGTHFRNN